jgi:sugar/nucleoside kinase (ribokinase family)
MAQIGRNKSTHYILKQMIHKFDLIGVGSPIVDVLSRVPEAFLERVGGQKGGMVLTDAESIDRWIAQLPQALTQSPGGSAGNTTFAAARLGLHTSFVGKIGNDSTGQYYRDQLTALGGDGSRFKLGGVPNGRCLSLITPDSERTLRTDLGAAATLKPEEISPADFTGCKHAHIEGYLLFNPDLMDAVLRAAKDAGCTISLDLASFEVVEAARERLPQILNTYVDLVFANEDEAAAWCGPNTSLDECARILASDNRLAAVKAGANGVWVAHKNEVFHRPALPGIIPIDTTGAGDFWAAGFLAGWLRGKALPECADWGARLGGEIVQVIGTQLSEETWNRITRALV